MNLLATENFKTLGLNVLPILKNQLKLAALIDNQYDATRVNAQEGSTISVKRPVVFAAKDFVSKIEIQSINRKLVDIKLNTFKDISFELTTQEATFIFNNDVKKSEELLKPALAALSDATDAEVVKLFNKIPFFVGDPAKAFDTPSSVTTPRKALVDRKVPAGDRKMVLSSAAYAEALGVDAFRDLEKSGSTAALREASLGKLFSFEIFESDQNLSHKVGTAIVSAAADITLSAESVPTVAADNNDVVNAEYNTLALDGLGAGDLEAGELFSITQAGTEYQFVSKAKVTAAGGAASIQAFPVYRDENGDAIKFASASVLEFAGKTVGAYEKSIAFHKQFAAFVPVALPDASAFGVQQTVLNADGIAFRMTADYDSETKKMIFSLDMLAGFAVLYPELAEIIIGG